MIKISSKRQLKIILKLNKTQAFSFSIAYAIIYIFISLMYLPVANATIIKPSCPATPIKIAFSELPPYYEQGSGIAVDLWKELIKRSGCRFDAQVRPRARLWKEIEKGTLGMSGAGVATPERETFANFAGYVQLKTLCVFKTSNSSKIKNMETIIHDDSLNIGIIRGIKYGGSIDRLIESVKQKNSKRINEMNTPEQLFNLFQIGRVQIIFAESLTYSRYFKSLKISDINVLDFTVNDPTSTVSLVMSKAVFSETEAARWRALVDSIRADGTMKTILRKYTSEKDANALIKF